MVKPYTSYTEWQISVDTSKHHIWSNQKSPFIPYNTYNEWRYMWDATRNREKLISAIITVSTQELSLTNKRWMCEYEESAHPTHLWINPNASAHDFKGKE